MPFQNWDPFTGFKHIFLFFLSACRVAELLASYRNPWLSFSGTELLLRSSYQARDCICSSIYICLCPLTSFRQWKVSRALYFTWRLLWSIPSPHCLCVLPARCKVVEGSGTGQATWCEEVGSPRHCTEGNSYWLETMHWTTSRRNTLFKKSSCISMSIYYWSVP